MTATEPLKFATGGYQQSEAGHWFAYWTVCLFGVEGTLRDEHITDLATESEARQWLAARILEDTK